MARVVVSRYDVIWNYIGTIVSMAGNFLLLPLLLMYLSEEEIGLWYIFIALSGFASLLEFGFTPTFARNIVYCVSGARKLSRSGFDQESVQEGVDWHFLRTVLWTTRLVYVVIAIFALSLCLTLGTNYIHRVASGVEWSHVVLPWLVFVAAIFMNLYFLYSLVFLRGVGDVAGENKAKTYARFSQLAVTAVLLIAGFGLLGASLGFLSNGFLLRLFAARYFKAHTDVQDGIRSDNRKIVTAEIKEVLSAVSYTAWRDGVVSVAWYGATQATTIICSLYLGLTETGTYSIMLQLATATYNISSAYMRSCFPTWQSAYARNDIETQRWVVCRGMSCYYASYLVATFGIIMVVFPVLPYFKENFILDIPLYLGVSVYNFLLNHHSLFCSLIVGTNRIPYFKTYIISSVVGVVLSSFLCSNAGMGAWGLVIGQALPQLAYNNWYWPSFVLKELNLSLGELISEGYVWWRNNLATIFK